MTLLPEVRLGPGDPAAIDADVLVVAIERVDDDLAVVALGDVVNRSLRDAARAVGHTGKAEEAARIPAPAGVRATSVLLVGLGELGELGDLGERRDGAHVPSRLRRAAGAALRSLDSVATVAVALPVQDAADAEAVATGALLGAYRYTAYRSDAARKDPVRTIIVAAPEAARPGIHRADVVARAVGAARDLVNQPPLDLYPESFAQAVADQARTGALRGRVQVDVLDDATLRQRGFGGLTGVGSGSTRGPRLVRIGYSPSGARRHVAFVGKGITFDSGGISLKPSANMEKMKSDMAGAAAVAQALFAVAELGLPVRVTAWLALAENMPSGSAVRPSDVLRIYGGKTVEVTNTDAEGRLVLADALVAAQEEAPDLVVDVATLTGAQVTALGYRTTGVMGTPSARDQVLRAADAAGEPMWGMPIPDELIRFFDSGTADLKNAGARAGGMLAAAAFLREFVGEGVEWAHLDVAGPAYNSDSAYGFTGLGGTGVPVRTLVEVARGMGEGR